MADLVPFTGLIAGNLITTYSANVVVVTGQNGQVGVNTNIYIDPVGRIGIGTSSPTTSLHVSDGNILVGSTGYGYVFPDGSFQTTAASNTPPGGTDRAIQFNNAGSFGGDVTKFTLDTNGNVGIGVSNPSYKLDVSGTLHATGAVTFDTVLGVASGGTGGATFTSNGVLYGNGTGTLQTTAQGGANTVLVANNGAPSFSSTLLVTSLTTTGVINAGGDAVVNSLTSNTSITANNGLTVNAGGANITGNLVVSGGIIIAGNISVNTSNVLVTEEPIIYVGDNNPANLWDLGIAGSYTTNIYRHTGLVRNHNDGVWTIFDNLLVEPTQTIDWSQPELNYGYFKAGNINVAATTSSTSTTTGALVTAGGVGIAGSLNVGNDAQINTLTVGLGKGSVASNTAFGYQSLNSNFNTKRLSGYNWVNQGSGYTNGYYTGSIPLIYVSGSPAEVYPIANSVSVTNGQVDWISFSSLGSGFVDTTTVMTIDSALIGGTGSGLLISVAGLQNVVGDYNQAIGYQALFSNTSGFLNQASGYQALFFNTSGYMNQACGYHAAYNLTTGSKNLAIGYESLYAGTDSWGNHAVGYQALHEVTTGYSNHADGYQALYDVTTGIRNVAHGTYSTNHLTTGSENTADGYSSLNNLRTKSYNSAFGAYAMSGGTGESNSAFGRRALNYSTGNLNCAFGALSLASTVKDNNTAFGYQALTNSAYTYSGIGAITGGSGYTNGTYTNIQLDPNDGYFYPPAQATIIVSGGSVTSVTITNSPNLTVGSPSYWQLHTSSALGFGGSNFKVAINYAGGFNNTAIGYSAGSAIITGQKNTLLGTYTGNAGPISQTGSNYVVLSDGDGNVRLYSDPNGNIGIGTTSATVSTKLGVYGGNIRIGSTGYGYVFPDGSFQTTAASNTPPGGTDRAIQFNNAGAFGGDVTKFTLDTNGNVGIGSVSPTVTLDMTLRTDAVKLPQGTTNQRPSGASGLIRYNTTINKFEGYTSAWGSLGGAVGGGSDDAFYENTATITADYTITTGKNAMTAGPITINSGVSITIPTGSVWTVV